MKLVKTLNPTLRNVHGEAVVWPHTVRTEDGKFFVSSRSDTGWSKWDDEFDSFEDAQKAVERFVLSKEDECDEIRFGVQ